MSRRRGFLRAIDQAKVDDLDPRTPEPFGDMAGILDQPLLQTGELFPIRLKPDGEYPDSKGATAVVSDGGGHSDRVQ